MAVTALLVAGSAVYAGAKTVITHRRQPQENTAGKSQKGELVNPHQGPTTLTQRRQRASAATAFFLATGGLFYTPLALISMPLTLYSSISILESAGWALYAEGRFKPSIINSILIMTTLATHHYLPAATLSWLHHSFKQMGDGIRATGEQMASEMNFEMGDLLRQASGASPETVWVLQNDVEMKLPFDEVAPGDLLVANRGEFVPVSGVITEGSARVTLVLVSQNPEPIEMGVGDQIPARAFVIEGRIVVQVEQIPT